MWERALWWGQDASRVCLHYSLYTKICSILLSREREGPQSLEESNISFSCLDDCD